MDWYWTDGVQPPPPHVPVHHRAMTAHDKTIRELTRERDAALAELCTTQARCAALERALRETLEPIDRVDDRLRAVEAAVVAMAPLWQPGVPVGRCHCKGRDAHLRGPGCAMVVEL